jgi:hypothetical protein
MSSKPVETRMKRSKAQPGVRDPRQIAREKRRNAQRKNNGVDWADWRPRYSLGKFVNVSINKIKRNGKVIQY